MRHHERVTGLDGRIELNWLADGCAELIVGIDVAGIIFFYNTAPVGEKRGIAARLRPGAVSKPPPTTSAFNPVGALAGCLSPKILHASG